MFLGGESLETGYLSQCNIALFPSNNQDKEP